MIHTFCLSSELYVVNTNSNAKIRYSPTALEAAVGESSTSMSCSQPNDHYSESIDCCRISKPPTTNTSILSNSIAIMVVTNN